MKYIRTKDGRIIEESKLEPGFRQTSITIIRRNDNKVLRQIICDDMDEYVETIVVGEYCKHHKINPKEIRYERTVLLNDVLNQADTIEELCDEFVIITDLGKHISFDEYKESKICYLAKDSIELYAAIWTDKGLIFVAKMNDKGDLCLI